jgi:sigma-E factor negative regulatory protein RseA
MKPAHHDDQRPATAGDATPTEAAEHPHAWLSALADGRADALEPGIALWRDDAEARRTWSTYHLIGDVMRSEDLASRRGHDAAFMAGIRARLAAEPVVLAPQPAPARRARQPWLMPVAAAAGVAVVAGVLVVTRLSLPGAEPGAGTTLVAEPVRPGAELASVAAGDPRLVRDPRLEELLRQHWAARGGMAAVAASPRALRPQPLTAVSTER